MSRWLRPAVWAVVLVVVCSVVAVVVFAGSSGGAGSGPSGDSDPGPVDAFPRSATYWLSQDSLPTAAELARYDVVVVDSEWAHREPQVLREARRIAPGIRLLAYVNLVDRNIRLGSPGYYADRYALWQFRDSDISTFPDAWLARTATGAVVSQWPDTLMTNLAATGPSVDGLRYPEYAARWVIDRVWATGLWDGVYLDVWGDRIYGASHAAWDVDGDGVDEPADEIYGPDGPWADGLTEAEQIMRGAMPGAILIANGDRELRGDLLDGRVIESFLDQASNRDPADDMAGYLAAAADPGHREPGLSMTINRRRALPGSAREYRNARFQLTGTLLQDGYWAPMGRHYDQFAWYDELDGGGLGRGYLGAPYVPDPPADRVTGPYRDGIGKVAPGVTRRDFEHGIVLHNAGSGEVTIRLNGVFRRITGSQAPRTNDGSVSSVARVPAGDGLILLRTGPATPR